MTFKELYFCNDRWDGKSLLTADIYPLNKEEKRQKRLIIGIPELLDKYSEYAVDTFKNDWVILREV